MQPTSCCDVSFLPSDCSATPTQKIPAMDKLYYFSHRVTVDIETSMEDLNDNDLFLDLEDDGGVAFEIEQVFGSDDN